ncbi:AMP-binding protein [Kineococcus esterisolvens]|uniref:AMP-binding protein n=1 Tax=unclassified Kineococcus TaxID=2621656 RepID=UPI003D7D077A
MRPQWDALVVLDGGATSWAELADDLADVVDGSRAVALVARDTRTPWAALAAAVRAGGDLLVVDGDRADESLLDRLRDVGYLVVDGPRRLRPTATAPARAGRVTVLTSGTTGAPKLVEHDLGSLVTRRAPADEPARRWLCPYSAGTYAWYQLATTGLFVPGQSVVPVAPRDLDTWVAVALASGVTAVSATPSFWRSTLLTHRDDELRPLPLRQLTLGGEPVEQDLLDELGRLFPDARLTHVYATSETGAVLAVSDGRAGFPVEWLDAPRAGGVRVRLRGDQLEVASPWVHRTATSEWVSTGDRAVVRDGRVHVVGREAVQFINVGGAKVDAVAVQAAFLSHPEVAWARVRGRRAPVLGQVPVADVVLRRGASATADDLRAHVAGRLPEVAVPRLVTLHDDIPLTPALKAAL